MTTTISNLPWDLIESIFSRVPLKSMKAVRLTCKTWNNLSKSESLTKMHIGRVITTTREGEAMVIVKMPQNLYLMRGFVDNVDPSLELKGQLSFLCNQVSIRRVLHYEGLLLCILKDTTKVVVWNPYLGQTRWIELRYSHRSHHLFSYALGYEDKESCRSVKFLRFIDYCYKEPETKFFWYEIYDFDSGLWTTLDVTPHWFIYCSSDVVSLKGNSYWCAKERSYERGRPDHIICFDFTRERFGPLLPLPPSRFRDHEYYYVTFSCVKEEKLAALFQDDRSYRKPEIWITTKIESEMVSWSKFLIMDTRPMVNSFFHSFIIEEEKKVVMGFSINLEDFYPDDPNVYPKSFIHIIGEAGYLKKLHLGVHADQNGWPLVVCSYVPSLIQIKNLAQGKRIEQNSLEKHRFDQYRLRLAAVENIDTRRSCRGRRRKQDD